jgi:tyrosinase
MSISRRHVLLQGCVIGAGVIAAEMPGIVALAQAPQTPERRSLAGLAWNDPIVASYRDAVAQMKQKADSDQLSWVSLAQVHGLDPNTYHFCPHGNWYFLPWHRAYTVMCERLVRSLTSNNDFAMPYWDWTNDPTIPDVFVSPTTPDGKPNALYVSDAGFERTWPAGTPMPPEIVGPDVLQSILNSTTYEEFGTSRPDGQDSLDPSWIINQDSGTQGVLEETPHNNVHNNIGGWMPTATSSRDPVFFMHHCNIDRIWALWNLHNQNSTDSLWTDMPFTNNFYNPDGTPYSPKVSDLFVPENLGYTYGLPAPAPASPPAVMAMGDKVRTLFAAAKPQGTAGVKTFVAQNAAQASATASKYLEIPVAVDATLLTAVARRRPASSGTELLAFSQARERAASGPRALAFIRDVTVSDPQGTMYRVFIDCDNLTPATPVTDPHYVGTFGAFEHGSHGGKHAKPSFVVDLTRAIQRVHGSSANPPARIKVQILPVANQPSARLGTAAPTQIEVAFVSV